MKLQLKAKGGFILDFVIREGVAIFQLFACKKETLLVWWDSLLVLDFGFYNFNYVTSLNLESECFSHDSLHKDLHTTRRAHHKVKSGLILINNTVVSRKYAPPPLLQP